MVNKALKQVWPDWKIEGEPLGKGSYGVVYKGVRRDHNVESYAAIKMISIPSDSSELEALRSEGLGLNATKTYLEGIVNDFVGEIQLMESLKGVQNIVSVEDYKVVEKVDELGWEIYIRMELLTPFNTYAQSKKLTEKDVIQLGCDICTALQICNKRNIIHRDIKPENIFINDFGYFKLGDFGIARKMENLTSGLSQKGTFNYMAPEVANSKGYDARVDTYSLGIVLYRLLNNNRLPFMETEQQLMNANERRLAVERRVRGEALPPPCNASPEMADVILRACAYNPDDRFATAVDMKSALQSVRDGTYVPVGKKAKKDKKKKKSENENAPGRFGKNSKKKFTGIVIGVLMVCLLVGAGFFAALQWLDKDTDNGGSQTENKRISEILDDAAQLADEGDYEAAIEVLESGMAEFPESEELQAKIDEYEALVESQKVDAALSKAQGFAEESNWLEAILAVEEAIDIQGGSEELSELLEIYQEKYVDDVCDRVYELIQKGQHGQASVLINEALKMVKNNQSLQEKLFGVYTAHAEYLVDVMTPAAANDYEEFSAETAVMMCNAPYQNGFMLDIYGWNGQSGAEFDVNGEYNLLSGVVGYVDDRMGEGKAVDVYVYTDDEMAFTCEVAPNEEPQNFTVDLTGASKLAFKTEDAKGVHGYIGFAELEII